MGGHYSSALSLFSEPVVRHDVDVLSLAGRQRDEK